MNVTPLIKSIIPGSGTFYTCSSANEDLQLSLADSNNKFRFSKFALLKLPELKTPCNSTSTFVNGNDKNYMELRAIPGAYEYYYNYSSQAPTLNTNYSFADSFQNYFYNLESCVTGESTYTINTKRTVSERVFFKWLKETGAIQFEEAQVGKHLTGTANGSSEYGTHYIERQETIDASGNYIYERVVKYIGNINVINSVKSTDNSYSEVYMHVPTSHGSTKDVLFTAYSDENYHPGMVMKQSGNTLYGRSASTEAVDEHIQARAQYDSLESFSQSGCAHWKLNTSDSTWYQIGAGDGEEYEWWYSNPDAYTYRTEEDGFDDPSDDIFAIGDDPNDDSNVDNVKFRRSRLDGISLEFNKDAYYKIKSNPAITTFGEYNASSNAESFSFNTILIYYDVYNVDNPDDFETNLFGVLFLDAVTTGVDSGVIESLTKRKPSVALQQNGNAYAFKLNIKLDLTSQDSGVEVSINDYNTYSLHLYVNALTEMRKNSLLLEQHIAKYRDLEDDIDKLESIIGESGTYSDLADRVTELEEAIEEADSIFENQETIMNLIKKNSSMINDIMSNKTPAEIAYNMDVIDKGSGIDIDRTDGSRVKIVNTKQCFNIGSKPLITLTSDASNEQTSFSYEFGLREFDNYLRINDYDSTGIGNPLNLDRNVTIKVNDTDVKWKLGQRFRISFTYGLTLENTNGDYKFYVYTGKEGNKYTKQAAILTSTSFTSSNGYKPIIEIICIDADDLTFAVDVF